MQVNASFGQVPAASLVDGEARPALVKDTTTTDFRTDVIAESARQPVLVDFWAPWCGPCKQLTPILEKVVNAGRGKVKLVKMNIDEHPQIAGQLGIKSIPAVIAFVNGQPVDGFMGALPEGQVKAFIDRISGPGGDPLDAALQEAEALAEAGQADAAAELYGAILAEDETNVRALGGLLRLQVATGRIEEARALIAALPPEAAQDPGVQSARAALDLIDQQAGLGALSDLEAKVAADPNDHAARLDYAIALNAANRREDAVDQLIESIRKNRGWNEEAARKQLLQFFEAWGFKDEASVSGRRKLSSVLYA